MCARRAWEKEFQCKYANRPRHSALKNWYTGTYNDIAKSKRDDMGVSGFRELLEEFPESLNGVKPLCVKLRSILFPMAENGVLETGTPAGPADVLYTRVIDAFHDAISNMADQGRP